MKIHARNDGGLRDIEMCRHKIGLYLNLGKRIFNGLSRLEKHRSSTAEIFITIRERSAVKCKTSKDYKGWSGRGIFYRINL